MCPAGYRPRLSASACRQRYLRGAVGGSVPKQGGARYLGYVSSLGGGTLPLRSDDARLQARLREPRLPVALPIQQTKLATEIRVVSKQLHHCESRPTGRS